MQKYIETICSSYLSELLPASVLSQCVNGDSRPGSLSPAGNLGRLLKAQINHYKKLIYYFLWNKNI